MGFSTWTRRRRVVGAKGYTLAPKRRRIGWQHPVDEQVKLPLHQNAVSRKSEYYRYLESSHWRNLRYRAFKRDSFKCVRCGSDFRLQGHHIRYRKNIFDCTVNDIQTLCKTCHEKHHREKAKERKANRGRRSERRLIWVLLNFDAAF